MMIDEYPILFEVTNTKQKKTTHCGVLEFVAEEGVVYLPYWCGKKNKKKISHSPFHRSPVPRC